MVKSADGALVYWDGQEDLMIKIPDTFKTKPETGHQVFGLCGTYDDNPKNDFVNAQGILAGSMKEFLNTWKQDPDLCDFKTEIKPPPPCYSPSNSSVSIAISEAEKICNVLREGNEFEGKYATNYSRRKGDLQPRNL